MKIGIRVDSSDLIGLGHVVRCIHLAKKLQQGGHIVFFISQRLTGSVPNLIVENGFQVYFINSGKKESIILPINGFKSEFDPWLNGRQSIDALETEKIIKKCPLDLLIVDHYSIDAEWEKYLKGIVKSIIVIDDLANRKHCCELLIDQNYVHEYQKRYQPFVNSSCKTLLGPKYVIIGDEYLQYKNFDTEKSRVGNQLLIYFGGSDKFNFCDKAIQASLASQIPDLKIHVVVNSGRSSTATICEKYKKNSRIIIHEDLPTLAHLLKDVVCAIGAGGTTTYERCFMKVWSIVITIADNQIPVAKHMSENGYIEWLGHQSSVDINSITKCLVDRFEKLKNEPNSMLVGQKLIDGSGTSRIVNEIIHL